MDKENVNRKRTYGWTRRFESDKIARRVVDVLDNFYKKYNLKPNLRKKAVLQTAFLCPSFFKKGLLCPSNKCILATLNS
jgi:hypothetical protein